MAGSCEQVASTPGSVHIMLATGPSPDIIAWRRRRVKEKEREGIHTSECLCIVLFCVLNMTSDIPVVRAARKEVSGEYTR